jgi:hypothetical protein
MDRLRIKYIVSNASHRSPDDPKHTKIACNSNRYTRVENYSELKITVNRTYIREPYALK